MLDRLRQLLKFGRSDNTQFEPINVVSSKYLKKAAKEQEKKAKEEQKKIEKAKPEPKPVEKSTKQEVKVKKSHPKKKTSLKTSLKKSYAVPNIAKNLTPEKILLFLLLIFVLVIGGVYLLATKMF